MEVKGKVRIVDSILKKYRFKTKLTSANANISYKEVGILTNYKGLMLYETKFLNERRYCFEMRKPFYIDPEFYFKKCFESLEERTEYIEWNYVGRMREKIKEKKRRESDENEKGKTNP